MSRKKLNEKTEKARGKKRTLFLILEAFDSKKNHLPNNFWKTICVQSMKNMIEQNELLHSIAKF